MESKWSRPECSARGTMKELSVASLYSRLTVATLTTWQRCSVDECLECNNNTVSEVHKGLGQGRVLS